MLKPVGIRRAIGVAAIAIFYYCQKMCSANLEEAGSGVNFTEVNGLSVEFPYDLTRNPLYILVVFFLFPVAAVVFDSKWYLYLMPFMYAYLHFIVIPAEEELLTGIFGQSYMHYSENVPRWFHNARHMG